MTAAGARPLRLGRIGYLNVLPLHYPLEHGILTGNCELISGPPAELNRRINAGELDVSGCSCIEYARHAEKYFVLPDLAIASDGPVRSVLLLCRARPEDLDGATVLLSAQSHTSVALVDLILRDKGVRPRYVSGDAAAALARGERPAAILTIGDEALRLRRHPDYPLRLDLGAAWREWTGLPFVFAVWIAGVRSVAEHGDAVRATARLLLAAKSWGKTHGDITAREAAATGVMTEAEARGYYAGLVYDLGKKELAGMRLFYAKLAEAGVISAAPRLRFLEP